MQRRSMNGRLHRNPLPPQLAQRCDSGLGPEGFVGSGRDPDHPAGARIDDWGAGAIPAPAVVLQQPVRHFRHAQPGHRKAVGLPPGVGHQHRLAVCRLLGRASERGAELLKQRRGLADDLDQGQAIAGIGRDASDRQCDLALGDHAPRCLVAEEPAGGDELVATDVQGTAGAAQGRHLPGQSPEVGRQCAARRLRRMLRPDCGAPDQCAGALPARRVGAALGRRPRRASQSAVLEQQTGLGAGAARVGADRDPCALLDLVTGRGWLDLHSPTLACKDHSKCSGLEARRHTPPLSQLPKVVAVRIRPPTAAAHWARPAMTCPLAPMRSAYDCQYSPGTATRTCSSCV